MNNHEIQVAWKYHDSTKHSYWSIRNHAHFLDWANRPLPFKIYPKIEPLPLPRDVPQTGVAALSAISQPVPSSRADSVPGVQDLARLLYFSAGITKQRAISRWRNLLSRRRLHRSSLRDRSVRRDWRSPGFGCRRVSLQSGGCIAT